MRIASLQPSITITLAALKKLDALCACTKYCLEALPKLAAQNPHILHDSWTANTDEILASKPDLVLASVPYRMESLAAILKSGLPVLTLAPHSLADIYKDIRLIAAVVDAQPEAEALITQMQSAIASTRQRSERRTQTPVVYCEEWGKPLIHSQSWVAELVEAAGGRYLGTPVLTPHQKTSPPPTPTSSSSPGAEQGIASPWIASSLNATGNPSKPSASAESSASPTNTSTPPPTPSSKAWPASPRPPTPTSTHPTPN